MAETLSVPPVTDSDLATIQRHRMLAQALMGETGNGSPVGSPWQALNRAISPLLGALTEKHASSQYGELSNAAAPELAQIAQSDNPIALVAASKNPLVRAMLPDLMQMQLQGTFSARNKGLEAASVGQAQLGFQPQLNAANAEAVVPAAIAKEAETMKATMPMQESLLRLKQALANSKPMSVPAGGQIIDPATGKVISSSTSSDAPTMPF